MSLLYIYVRLIEYPNFDYIILINLYNFLVKEKLKKKVLNYLDTIQIFNQHLKIIFMFIEHILSLS